MHERPAPIGKMLLDAGLINEDQLRECLSSQTRSGRMLGEELVAQGHISEVQMTQVLSNQLSVPWVSLKHVVFTTELLAEVSKEVAAEYRVVPVYLRPFRDGGGVLFVAMEDPTAEDALAALRGCSDYGIKPMVAPPSEISHAIGMHYGVDLPGGNVSSGPAPAKKTGAGVESEIPRLAAGLGTKTVTLLDGTTVYLAYGDTGLPDIEEVTDSELIRGMVHGDRDLGADVGAKELVAAVVSLLLKKGLLQDGEVSQELHELKSGL